MYDIVLTNLGFELKLKIIHDSSPITTDYLNWVIKIVKLERGEQAIWPWII